ncbi:hypothetical protein BLNAU_16497 [Blattamonas nauphoetae]|uniref:Uncharacterized protein n=1 Tax=Blattamonas nauphoetae TaxID=2049346 RepID=A0ABQ9X8E2_9EUKA|nr:hypothetical protein BLNAU_16497 [Blattamonas nauphoetae]
MLDLQQVGKWDVIIQGIAHWLSGTQPSTRNPVEVLQASVRLMSKQNTSIPQLSKYIRTFLMFATETGTILLQTQIEDLHRILTLNKFIDLIGLTVSMPDFEANRVRVLKEPELELTSKYPVSMEELLHHLDQEYLQTVFSHTSQQLDSSMRKLENKRNAVESLVTDTLSGTRRRSSASPSPSRFTSPSPLRNKSNADGKLRIDTEHLNTTKHTHSRSSSPISSRTIRRRGNAVFYSSPTKAPPFSNDSPTHEYLRNATLLKQQRQDEIDDMLSTMSSRTNLSIVAPQSPTKTPHPQSLVTPKESSPMRSPTRLSISPRLFPAHEPPKFPSTPKFPAPPFVFSDANVTCGLNRTEGEIVEEQKHTLIPNLELIKKRKFPHKMPEVPWQFVVDKDGHLFDQAHNGATDPSSELPQATDWETQYETDHKPLRPFSPPKPNWSPVFNHLHHTEIMESAFVLSEELEAELARKRKEAKEEREKKFDEIRAERERRKEEREEWLNRMVRKDAFRKEYMVIGGGNQSNSNDTALPTRISPTRKDPEKIDRSEKKFDKRKAQTSEQMDDMFTQQLIAITEEGHAITKLIHLGKEDVDEDEQENASQASDSNNPLHKYSLEETKLTHQNMTGFERKKYKMETRLGKAQNAIQSCLAEFARQREEKEKRGAKIESREKRRKVEMKKILPVLESTTGTYLATFSDDAQNQYSVQLYAESFGVWTIFSDFLPISAGPSSTDLVFDAVYSDFKVYWNGIELDSGVDSFFTPSASPVISVIGVTFRQVADASFQLDFMSNHVFSGTFKVTFTADGITYFPKDIEIFNPPGTLLVESEVLEIDGSPFNFETFYEITSFKSKSDQTDILPESIFFVIPPARPTPVDQNSFVDLSGSADLECGYGLLQPCLNLVQAIHNQIVIPTAFDSYSPLMVKVKSGGIAKEYYITPEISVSLTVQGEVDSGVVPIITIESDPQIVIAGGTEESASLTFLDLEFEFASEWVFQALA